MPTTRANAACCSKIAGPRGVPSGAAANASPPLDRPDPQRFDMHTCNDRLICAIVAKGLDHYVAAKRLQAAECAYPVGLGQPTVATHRQIPQMRIRIDNRTVVHAGPLLHRTPHPIIVAVAKVSATDCTSEARTCVRPVSKHISAFPRRHGNGPTFALSSNDTIIGYWYRHFSRRSPV